MPVQKGKRRRRPRQRNRDPEWTRPEPAAVASSPVQKSGRGRSRWQGPPWFNAVLGGFMLITGIVFFILPQKGIGVRDRLLLLIAYLVLGTFYMVRAYRAYRRPRSS